MERPATQQPKRSILFAAVTAEELEKANDYTSQ